MVGIWKQFKEQITNNSDKLVIQLAGIKEKNAPNRSSLPFLCEDCFTSRLESISENRIHTNERAIFIQIMTQYMSTC